ncbi:hypothetical protein IWX90DRAFT_446134 [Phyllosticta citrichinensis]|uniref:Uncharacterized protein n=1 Tax=Phyllosticta citrichinensis TaxID=1130410 RepID=A0ABR1XF91_9PEZI
MISRRLPVAMPIRRHAAFQCLNQSPSSTVSAAVRFVHTPNAFHRRTRTAPSWTASNGSTRQFSVSSSQRQSMKDARTAVMGGRKEKEPSFMAAQRDAQNIKLIPRDIGLLPGTFIRPRRADMPGILEDPKKRLMVEYKLVKSYFTSAITLGLYKFKSVKPRPKLTRKGVPELAKTLYEQMYTAFAFGDIEHLRQICADGIVDSFSNRIAQRDANQRLYWRLLSSHKPKFVSDRCVQLPYPGGDSNKRPIFYRQVIYRIRSQQALVKGTVKRTRHGEQLLDTWGKELPVDKDGEVTRERMEQEAREVTELFVVQKRMFLGKEEKWYAWGLTQETPVSAILE